MTALALQKKRDILQLKHSILNICTCFKLRHVLQYHGKDIPLERKMGN